MTPASGSTVSVTCRAVGFECEWAARGGSVAELEGRFAEHAKCAHSLAPMPPDVSEHLRAAMLSNVSGRQ
jgi:predicted small metal-binding protein